MLNHPEASRHILQHLGNIFAQLPTVRCPSFLPEASRASRLGCLFIPAIVHAAIGGRLLCIRGVDDFEAVFSLRLWALVPPEIAHLLIYRTSTIVRQVSSVPLVSERNSSPGA